MTNKNDKYEYHKQNDYPGERIAEKKRVSDREEAASKRCDIKVAEKGRTDEIKADNRVAMKGRMDNKIMESEIEKTEERTRKADGNSNTVNIILASILLVFIAGLGWSYMTIQQQSNDIDALNSQISNPSEPNPVVIPPVTQLPVVTTQTNYQAAQTTAENFIKQLPTYSYDGSNLKFNKSLTLNSENCGGTICYQFVYDFVSSHSGYGDRTGQNLPIVMTNHQIVVTIRNGVVYDAYIDHAWNSETQKKLVSAP
ncbi:MAG: hypothetical protein WC755_07280 [Candidatus Woesearchaeota archaeon]